MSRWAALIDSALFLSTLVCCPVDSHAQDGSGALRLDSLVVTAARWPQTPSELVADVTVIGRDDIARAGAQSLAELLQRVPGAEIVMNGGPASTSGVFLRGANSNQTLVLIDGQRVGSSTSGTAALEAIPLDAIDHIEILRGPASNLYGADAIGGVIQVFTRNGGDAFAAHASAGYGTYGTSDVSGGVSGAAAAWRYALDAGHRQSAGFNAIVNPANVGFNDDRDGYRGDHVSGNVSFRLAPEQELSARFLNSHLNAQFDAEPGFDDRTITTVDSYALASRNRLNAWWTSTARARADRRHQRLANRIRAGSIHDAAALVRLAERLPAAARLARRGARTPRGACRRRRRVRGNGTHHQRGRRSLPSRRRAAGRAAQPAARRQHAIRRAYDRRAGLRLRLRPRLARERERRHRVQGPDVQRSLLSGVFQSALRPETARNAELALRYASDNFGAGIVAYRNRVRDLIVFECDADFNCAPQNVAAATLQGVTLDVRFRSGTTAATASIDLQRPQDESGLLLPRRARRHAALAIDQPLGPLRLRAELSASSTRFDDAANTRRMGGYALLNLLVEWPFGARWTAFARLDNVMDKHYELAADYRTAGANVFAGMRWRY